MDVEATVKMKKGFQIELSFLLVAEMIKLVAAWQVGGNLSDT